MGSAANLWSLVRLGIGALTSKDGQGDKVSGTPGPVGSTKGQETAARYYPWGYDSRSPTGGKRLCVAPVGGSNLVQVGERNDAAKPDYDDEGWTTIVHNEVAGTWVKLRKDGGVQVGGKDSLFELKADGTAKWTAKGGASVELTGTTIKLNGGSLTANRQGDPVIATADFIIWLQGLATKAAYPTPLPPTFAVTGNGCPTVLIPS